MDPITINHRGQLVRDNSDFMRALNMRRESAPLVRPGENHNFGFPLPARSPIVKGKSYGWTTEHGLP